MQWLKNHIKEDIIGFLLLAFLIGVGLIFFAGRFTAFNISDGEKVNGAVLWLTALAIFWYAYETYQLKKSATDQVTLQEEIMLNEFLPILEPISQSGGPVLKTASFRNLRIRNLGRGPAKYIKVYVGALEVQANLSLASQEAESVFVQKASQPQLRKLLAAEEQKLKLKIEYEDIYGRKFRTGNITLTRDAKTAGYHLKKGSWDFVRLPGKVSPR